MDLGLQVEQLEQEMVTVKQRHNQNFWPQRAATPTRRRPPPARIPAPPHVDHDDADIICTAPDNITSGHSGKSSPAPPLYVAEADILFFFFGTYL